MAAEDELALPHVPEASPNDAEDVSWALSTAEAMWARGDHLEGIKWVRKAAEAAADVDNDARALVLAKAASELASIVARRSLASIGEAAASRGRPPPVPAAASQGPRATLVTAPGSAPPAASGSAPPAASGSAPPKAGSAPPKAGSAPPKAGSAPPVPPSGSTGKSPLAPKVDGTRGVPRPLATAPTHAASSTSAAAPKSVRGKRRSQENLDAEARAAGVLETAPHAVVDSAAAERVLRTRDRSRNVGPGPAEGAVANTRTKRRSRPDLDDTVIARAEDLDDPRERSVAAWDASPTQDLTGDEMDHIEPERETDGGDRMTAFGIDVPAAPPTASTGVAGRSAQPALHDPHIQTSQAVRVVVWRDANGVHVAPAGTVVSAITIDAVLVVLEEGADLTAWLSKRER